MRRQLLLLSFTALLAIHCSNTVGGRSLNDEEGSGGSSLGGENSTSGDGDSGDGDSGDGDMPSGGSDPEGSGGSTGDGDSGGTTGQDPFCGDGEINTPMEECDDGTETADCTADCKESTCGDGYTNAAAGEACDDGEENGAFNSCDNSCLFECLRNCPLRVDLADGNNDNDGSTWKQAYRTIEAAVEVQAFASGGDVWVTSGTTGTLEMAPGVRIYGGFSGSEASVGEREASSRTVVDQGSGNVQAVIGARNAELNGFTIRNGSASTEGTVGQEKINGGGLYAVASTNLVIANCDFEDNLANDNGGGLYISGGDVLVKRCMFSGNQAPRGGAIYVGNGGKLRIEDTVFDDNSLKTTTRPLEGGAALYIDGTSPEIVDSIFRDNKGYEPGGGFEFGPVIYSKNASPSFFNVDFYSNRYSLGSSSYLHQDSTATYTNCTFSYHNQDTPNSSLVVDTGSSGSTLTNCTFTENVATLVQGVAGTSVYNSIFYRPDFNAGAASTGTVARTGVCEQIADGTIGQEEDVLVRPYPDEDANGIPDFFLNQTIKNPCFGIATDAVAADAAGLGWDSMTTSPSGCKDLSPLDVGKHYSTVSDAPVCL